LSYLVFS